MYESRLKPFGWKRKGPAFRLICEDTGKIVNVIRPWTNTDDYYWFGFECGIYCESGETITDKEFDIYLCQVKKHVNGWPITKDTDAQELSEKVNVFFDHEVIPWFDMLSSKEKIISAFSAGDIKLDFHAAEFLVENGYGLRLLPKLLDNYQIYGTLLDSMKNMYDIPILNDDRIYDIFIAVNGEKYNKNEVKATAEYFNVNYSEAAKMLLSGRVLLKSGNALTVRQLINNYKDNGIVIKTEPAFPDYNI